MLRACIDGIINGRFVNLELSPPSGEKNLNGKLKTGVFLRRQQTNNVIRNYCVCKN